MPSYYWCLHLKVLLFKLGVRISKHITQCLLLFFYILIATSAIKPLLLYFIISFTLSYFFLINSNYIYINTTHLLVLYTFYHWYWLNISTNNFNNNNYKTMISYITTISWFNKIEIAIFTLILTFHRQDFSLWLMGSMFRGRYHYI